METRFKELRKACGLTQTAIAKEIGVAQQAYQRYETGEREPSLASLCRLADFYNTSVDVLLCRKPPAAVTDEERELLTLYRRLSEPNRRLIMNILKAAFKDGAPAQDTEHTGIWTPGN